MIVKIRLLIRLMIFDLAAPTLGRWRCAAVVFAQNLGGNGRRRLLLNAAQQTSKTVTRLDKLANILVKFAYKIFTPIL